MLEDQEISAVLVGRGRACTANKMTLYRIHSPISACTRRANIVPERNTDDTAMITLLVQ